MGALAALRLKAVEETARWIIGKIAAIREREEHTGAFVCAPLPKVYTRKLVEVVFAPPDGRIGKLVERDIAPRQSASRNLKELVSIGVLEEVQVGKQKVFIHPKLMQLLTHAGNAFERYV